MSRRPDRERARLIEQFKRSQREAEQRLVLSVAEAAGLPSYTPPRSSPAPERTEAEIITDAWEFLAQTSNWYAEADKRAKAACQPQRAPRRCAHRAPDGELSCAEWAGHVGLHKSAGASWYGALWFDPRPQPTPGARYR